jgi:AraC family transcriptional regulator
MRGTDLITFGSTVRSLRVPGGVLTETVHAAGMELPRHEHANANVNFVLRGEFGERIQGEEYSCRTGSVLLKPGGAAHSNQYGVKPTRCLVVEISPGGFGETDERAGGNDVCYTEDTVVEALGWRLYRELLQPDSATPLLVGGLLTELLDRIGGERELKLASRRQPPWLKRVRERLDCAALDLDFDALVAEADVHRRHLMRAFGRYIGCSIGEYVRRGWVRRAQRLLADTPTPLAVVAVEAGFYDQSHFGRVFERVTGMRPQEYRGLTRSACAESATPR